MRKFFVERKLRMNNSKSEIVQFGYRKKGKILDIPLRLSAKYLGVHYNSQLDVKFALRKIEAKSNFIRWKLGQVRWRADFRTNYNLWQIFISPLIRMVVSLVGEWNSARARDSFQEIRRMARKTLREFTNSPKYSPNALFDFLANYQDESLIQILKKCEGKARDCTGNDLEADNNFVHCFDGVDEPGTRRKIKKVHPEIKECLRIINKYFCREH